MPKLTDTHRVILTNAAKRDDGSVLPLPKSLAPNKGPTTNVLRNLLKKGLIAEQAAGTDDEVWREQEGQRLTLVITDDGLTAIGIEPEDEPSGTNKTARANAKKPCKEGARSTHATVPAPQSPFPSVRPGTKQALLIDLLKRKRGATIPEVIEATGWQAHSVRGAISGALKKKLGLTVTSEPDKNRGRVYRIVGAA